MNAFVLRLLSFSYGVYLRLVSPVSEQTALRITRVLFGTLALPFTGRRRENMRKFFGAENMSEERFRQIDRQWKEYIARDAAENARLNLVTRESFLSRHKIRGEENLQAALALGRGVLLVSGHMGNYIGPYSLLALHHYDISFVIYDTMLPEVERHLNQAQTRVRMNKSVVGRDAARVAARAFRNKGIFAAVVDLAMRPAHAVRHPFGKTTIALDRGPARLAVRFDVPVLPVTAYIPEPYHTEVCIGPAFPPITAGDEESRIAQTLVQWRDWLEKEVTARPEQWWCWSFLELGTPPESK